MSPLTSQQCQNLALDKRMTEHPDLEGSAVVTYGCRFSREKLFSHGVLPFSHGFDPFSKAHEMLMGGGGGEGGGAGRSLYTDGLETTDSLVDEGGRGMDIQGARPRIRLADAEDESNSPTRSYSEIDEGNSLYPSPDPPDIVAESPVPFVASPTMDIPTALSSLMSLTTSDYYPVNPYPSPMSVSELSSSCEISSSRMPPEHPETLPRAQAHLTDLPESLVSPMRLSKPKRNPPPKSETHPAKMSSSSSSSYSSSSYFRDSYSPTREEMEREIEMKKKKCEVCGDVARSLHFGGLACDSCKAFFRRGVISGGHKDFVCCNGNSCVITAANRRSCQACRFAGCLKAGMNMSLVQHDPKNSSGRQYSKVNDHPAFQQDITPEYRDNQAFGSSRLSTNTDRYANTSSSYLHDQHKFYSGVQKSHNNYTDPSLTYEGEERYEPYLSDNLRGASNDFSRSHYSDTWDYDHKRKRDFSKLKINFSGNEANENKLLNETSQDNSTPASVRSKKGLKAFLGSQDYAEIKKLRSAYVQSFNKIPLEDTIINENNLGVYYSYFIQSRTRFLAGIPIYKTLAVADRKKILQIAVSMSTYIVGAQYVDLENHVIENRDGDHERTTGPSMTINTLRQFMTNDQFVEVMMFFSNHSSLYSDMIVSLLMQIMGLTYPEPGLSDSVVLEAGRCHYGGLLSRYLMAIYGSAEGQKYFQTLLESQHEARKLADMLQHLDLVHQARQRDNSRDTQILGDGIRLVCDEAREGLSKTRLENRKTDDYSCHTDTFCNYYQEDDHGSTDDTSKLHIIESTLQKLARCDDPNILADARRILPVELLKRFSDQLSDDLK